MKRSLDYVTPSTATKRMLFKRSCPSSPSATASTTTSSGEWQAAKFSSGTQLFPRCPQACNLEVQLKEEGLIRHIFTFLNVCEHQILRSCSRTWKQIICTLALDRLDMSLRSPLTPSTIDRAFTAIVHNYSSVRHLDLSGQRSLLDRDLLVLSSRFWAHLEHISLDDCLELTDFGLLSVLNAHSLHLRSISMRHCKGIKGHFTRQQITGRHPSLTCLDFFDTRVEYAFVNELETHFPSLHEINALHTPAHFDLLHKLEWDDLVNDLLFLVTHEHVELPQLNALFAEFELRANRWLRIHSTSATCFQRSLLSHGKAALLNAPLSPGDCTSALLFAAENGLTKVLRQLLKTDRACVDVTDIHSASPLCIAAGNGLTCAVRMLLKAGADVNHRTYCLATPLYLASEMNWDDVIDILLTVGAKTDCVVVGGATPLCVAAKNGNHAAMRKLLAAQVDPLRPQSRWQLQFVQALFLACEQGHADIVEDLFILTDVNANVLMDNSVSPLYLACQIGHAHIVALLLRRGANPNFRRPNGGVSCLYIAAQEGKDTIVKQLIGANANIHARMGDLSTALHIAARMGHVHVAQMLLAEGACINDETRSGLTPLYIACEEGHVTLVNFLLEHPKILLDHQTKNGTTALFVASQKNHVAIVQALLMRGANALLPKHNGTTPMDAASLLGHYEVTTLLLQYGAQVGGMALHFARQRRDSKLHSLLVDRYQKQHTEMAGNGDQGGEYTFVTAPVRG